MNTRMISNPILILEYFNTSEHNPNGNWQIHVVS